jgi:hypothetical protein
MATKNTAPKSVKITTSNDITAEIAGAYSALINHDGELAFILETADLMTEGKATVRGVSEAIASTVGTAPTIRKSHAQHFPILAKVIREVKGADLEPIAELLKLAERVTRNHGEKSGEVIATVKNVKELAEKSPTQTNARKNGGKNAKVTAPLTLELALATSLEAIRRVGGKNLKEVKTADLDTLRALLGVLVTIEKNSRVSA